MSEPATVDVPRAKGPAARDCAASGHPPVVGIRQPGEEARQELRCECGKYVWERMPSLG